MAKESSQQSLAVPGRIGSIRHYSAHSEATLLRFHCWLVPVGLAAVEVAAVRMVVARAGVAPDCWWRWRLRPSLAAISPVRLPWNLKPRCQNQNFHLLWASRK